MMENRWCVLGFLILCIIAVSLIGFYQTNESLALFHSAIQRSSSALNLDTVKNDLKATKLCVLKEVMQSSSDVWPKLHKIINNCSFVHRALKRPFIPFTTDKLFIPYTDSPSKFHCNVVSLGVGGEVVMEEQLKKLYPVCNFFGADPFSQTADVYKRVGTVFTTAVDAMSGSKMLNTLKGAKYSWNEVKVTSLGDFLKNMLHINRVHYLSMDIEGSEYRLLPYMASTGLFDHESDSSTICQISAEFHGPLSYYNYTHNEFEKILTNFLSASMFVPIKALNPGHHHRVFFMNAENDYCLSLFY